MEKRIKERFNDAILHEAMGRYGVAPDKIHLLAGFESFMYEFEREGATYILRIGHSFRRSEALIHGEVDWLNYLAGGGAGVARALLSAHGRLVEAVDDAQGEQFLATAFIKAQGGPVWSRGGWSPERYELYGQLLGRMHALSRDYQVPDPAWARPQWDDPLFLDIVPYLPAGHKAVADRFRALTAHLATLSQDRDGYGLIHFDAHAGNFFIDELDRITLFDFDDCQYSWYANDLAIVLFYMVMGAEDPAAYTQDFLSHFLRGYRRENRLDPRWLAEVPSFLKLREIDLYAIIHRSFGPAYLENAWCARFMDGRQARIEAGIPYIDFDFESLAGLL
ncbi:MAG TPA: phosphotransferase [Anaerolineae bacterium]|nr:phosphotransferase [Anaerolineae bacterium]